MIIILTNNFHILTSHLETASNFTQLKLQLPGSFKIHKGKKHI